MAHLGPVQWYLGVEQSVIAIARFLKRHLSALGHVFVQALALCQVAGMVRLGWVAFDGTKVGPTPRNARR